MQKFLLLGGLFLFMLLAAKCSASSDGESVAEPEKPVAKVESAKPAEVPDWRRIAYAKDQVRSQLRDPDSAVFDSLYVSRSGGVPIVCGLVNSRNGYGGMTGNQRFLSGSVTAMEEQMKDGEMSKVWDQFC